MFWGGGWEGGFGVWGWRCVPGVGLGAVGLGGGGQEPPDGQAWSRKGSGASQGGGGPCGRKRHPQEAAPQVGAGTAPPEHGGRWGQGSSRSEEVHWGSPVAQEPSA